MKNTFLRLIALLILTGCGASDSYQDSRNYQGIVSSEVGLPLENVNISLYETAETGTTDESGRFEIESYRSFPSISIYLESQKFSNTIKIEQIPENTSLISLVLEYNSTKNQLSIKDILFNSVLPTPTESPQATPSVNPSATPTKPDSLFDQNGSTTGFSIPKGLKGTISRGRSVWSNTCSSCHSQEKTGKTYATIKSAFRRIPDMRNTSVSNQEIADVTAYLNRNRR